MQVKVLKIRQLSQPSSQFDPNIAAVLNTLMESQKRLLERQMNSPNVMRITSTNDKTNSNKIFRGNLMDNASKWIKQVERISTLANSTNELKFTHDISHLAGSAKNWQLTLGYLYNDWNKWKAALTKRFKKRITMQEFLAHQSDHKLKRNESLVDYIYTKDALFEETPFTVTQSDRISMIIGDITAEKW
ncbi:hypothetical protein AVEN_95664-1 [Araneus ventricosus]|uniref:Retrotransposon gag domain-containing protein n=1 Tax=Araneus ventricosus TaxID=182803 RepID=A0A4Y2J4J1_ARAVE|nr:hypothetical protein AVEN_95664-1 [Araneus ventricosus]